MEKKIAKELNSFAKKWEGRMIKVNPFPQGSYQAVTMAGPHQARAAASMHLAVATKLHDGKLLETHSCHGAERSSRYSQLRHVYIEIGANLTAHGKSNYKRRLGRLGPLSEANKAFKWVVALCGVLIQRMTVLCSPGRLMAALLKPASTQPS